MKLSRKVGDIIRVNEFLPLADRFRPSLEGVVVELKPEMLGYIVEGPDGTRWYMGPMEFSFTGRNVKDRFERVG